MSLINEALKKAQRLRTEDPAGQPAPGTSGAGAPRIAKRSQPRSSQQLVLLVAGVVVLFILAVVGTVWLINRPSAPKPSPAIAATPAAPKVAPTAPVPSAPIIKVPLVTPAPGNEAPATATAAVAPPPVAKGNPPPPSTPPASPVASGAPPIASTPKPAVASEPASAPAAETRAITFPVIAPDAPAVTASPSSQAPVSPPKSDERVHVFVDAIHVTGIRSSASGDSRVLMNDRVIRLNDIVDRNLGIRLTRIDPDTLTFTDVNGVTYVKHF